jgi:small redox-active disulfide protein 2
MKRIQVLGIGCPTCDKLRKNAEAAVAELSIEATVEMVSDVNTIIGFDVLMTPALVIDGAVKAVGKVPTADDIKRFLT